MVTRRRCSECRCRLTPSPRARTTQRVCGAACRVARDRKLARRRRRKEIADYRADQLDRQQAVRDKRARAKREAAEVGAPRHAPASAAKSANYWMNLPDLWIAPSRRHAPPCCAI